MPWAVVDAHLSFTLVIHTYSAFTRSYRGELNKFGVRGLPTEETNHTRLCWKS
jgi:hypothetical protein